MTNNINGISDIIQIVSALAKDDWRVSAGLMAAGVILGLVEGVRRWRKRKKK